MGKDRRNGVETLLDIMLVVTHHRFMVIQPTIDMAEKFSKKSCRLCCVIHPYWLTQSTRRAATAATQSCKRYFRQLHNDCRRKQPNGKAEATQSELQRRQDRRIPSQCRKRGNPTFAGFSNIDNILE